MAISRRTLRHARAIRVDIDTEVEETVADIVKAWGVAWDAVADEWRAAVAELVAGMTDGRWPSRAVILRNARVQRAMQITAAKLEELGQQAGVRIVQGVPDLLSSQEAKLFDVVRSQLPDSLEVDWARVSDHQLDAIVKRTTKQITSRLRPLPRQVTAGLKQELIRGVVTGTNPNEVARILIKRFGVRFTGGAWRARTVARTELLDVTRNAALASRQANRAVLSGWRWMCALAARTCPSCLAMNGRPFDVDEPGPEGHQNCVLPGAVVTGPRAEAATSRWYAGEVIDIETVNGHHLSVTPNHPILTSQGWVAAGLLHEGGDVVSSGAVHGPAQSDVPDDHQVPTRIEDVADSLRRSLAVRSVRVPTSAEDFHGDGVGSKVHVVTTDRQLWRRLDAARGQHAAHGPLFDGDVALDHLAGLRGLGQRFLRARKTSLLVLGSLDAAPNLLRVATLHRQTVGAGLVPPGHTGDSETCRYHVAGRAVRLRERVLGLPGQVALGDLVNGHRIRGQRVRRVLQSADDIGLGSVAPETAGSQLTAESVGAYVVPGRDDLAAFAGDVVVDRILHLARRSWQGHVYNLQTATGWYVANSIVVHNCRCTGVPVTKTWRDLGIDAGEPTSAYPDAKAWFGQQTPAVQQQIMGKDRLSALNSGKLSWDKLAVKKSNPGWRDSWVPRAVPK